MSTPEPTSSRYHLAPELAVEYFDAQAIIFVGATESFLTVNRQAADLLRLLMTTFAEASFERPALVALLLDEYDLDPDEANRAADQLLVDWTTYEILLTEAA